MHLLSSDRMARKAGRKFYDNTSTLYMMRKTLFILLPAALLLVMLFSCEYNQLPEPDPPDLCDTVKVTYEDQMMSIIENSCAYSGCHDGMGGVGPFNYHTYDGLSNVFDKIETRVIVLEDDPASGMPPNSSIYPQSRKDNLTAEELDLFRCWIAEGFPKN